MAFQAGTERLVGTASRNEANLACGSERIAWIEYMPLSNEELSLFQPHKAMQLVNNISWVLITVFFRATVVLGQNFQIHPFLKSSYTCFP